MGKRLINLAGQRFGFLLVVDEARRGIWDRRWNCVCDCGTEKAVAQAALRGGKTVSCGCKRGALISAHRTTHGKTKTKLFGVWAAMHNRCNNPRYPQFALYGGRGVQVCDEWGAFECFELWALSAGYAEGLSIDRVNNDGHYEPTNCRWTDAYVQGANKRNNRHITHEGATRTLSEWARHGGIPTNVLHSRLRNGWPMSRAIAEPHRARKGQ